MLLVGDDYETGYVLNYVWCWCQTTLLSLLLNLVCNNYVNSDVCEIFVNYDVTCDWLCWIMYDLGLYVGWIEILHDTRWTTEFIWVQVWWFDYLGGCYCTYALINWTVLWQARAKWPRPCTPAASHGQVVFLRPNCWEELVVSWVLLERFLWWWGGLSSLPEAMAIRKAKQN